MEVLQKIIGHVGTWFGNLSAENWYVLGTVVGSIFATIGITAWIKRKYLQKNAKKLASEFIVLNVAFWSFLLVVADFVITQGTAYGALLPFVSVHWAQISSGAIAVHAIATALKKWWQERKENKPLTIPTLTPVIDQPIPPVTQDIWHS